MRLRGTRGDYSTIGFSTNSTHSPEAAHRSWRRYRWQPEEPGIEFRPVPETAEPDKDKARRLAQMWSIARRFKVEYELE